MMTLGVSKKCEYLGTDFSYGVYLSLDTSPFFLRLCIIAKYPFSISWFSSPVLLGLNR